MCMFGVVIWMSWNQLVHEKKSSSNKDISDWILRYKGELDDLVTMVRTRSGEQKSWKPPVESYIKINFDGAFDLQQNRSGSGVVARNSLGEILASKSVIHSSVLSLFAAETLACL
ncbi:hypothetical protein J1N35_012351 [Gossypium stocksii]|uniref:RNase H type-1 domain-containing protein n=1 Tax=Gossypium stocksii TaxID=47602 RepID=A0A9D4AEA0_9ROSI|nr:hypothetical protein J1N35_012351 [Gossypium stocksii]